ncbi:hypothetical protein [Bradyrhizobium erythrophlei]|jgi:hypothetical protein|uniref:DprA winged helix domain-containing protein n=1 Tax=Bradyrhizobium erythrophlei TaxID=1437360 RepID=A0A1M5XCK2_9BRAD|nr:hypothetical protein [Bradyrhizobium erythrophlei]SHH96923.1 hypothetical protein SAMN05443248_7186 [Bradyrhizobium erythrophlei]
MNCPPGVLDEVVARLCPAAGKTLREIHRDLQFIAPSSVRSALLVLVRSGRASFEGEMGNRRYRLSEAP